MSPRLQQAAGLALMWAVMALPIRAQDTQPSDAATRLRDIAETVEQNELAAREQTERLARAEIDNRRLTEQVMLLQAAAVAEMWKPGTVLEAGKAYRLPELAGAVYLRVNVDNVALIGGTGVYSTPEQPGIDIKPGTRNAFVWGVHFDRNTGPEPAAGKKYGIGPCVRDRGTGTQIVGCTVGRVDSFVLATDDSKGLTVSGNRQIGPGLRAYWFYIDGSATGATVTGSVAPHGSILENVCRASPSKNVIPSRLTFTHNEISTANKACLDLRQIDGATVKWNKLASAHKTKPDGRPGDIGTVFSVGPGGTTGINAPQPWEHAMNVEFVENECTGAIRVIPGASGVTIERNAGSGFRAADPFILIEARGKDAPLMIVDRLRVVDNKAKPEAGTTAPIVSVTRGDGMPEGWAVLERNDWQ